MGRHLSVSKELKKNYKKLLNHKYVKNISRQYYHPCKHKYIPGTIRYKLDTTTGIKVTAYDGSGCVDMYVYIESLDKINEVKKYLEELK